MHTIAVLVLLRMLSALLLELAGKVQAVTYEEGEGLLELAHLLLGQ